MQLPATKESNVIRLPLGARSHQLASSNPHQLSDRSLVLASRPVMHVNQPVLMIVLALGLLTLGLAMWLIVSGGRHAADFPLASERLPKS